VAAGHTGLTKRTRLSGAADLASGSSYAARLRVVGALLDRSGTDLALIHVSTRRVRVLAVGPFGQQVLSLRYLDRCIAAQRQLRGHLPPRDPGDATALSSVLRAVGAELDRQRRAWYRLALTRGAVVIEGAHGYRRTLALEHLTALLQQALERRVLALVEEPSP
jgi:hypothetical protein